MIERDAPGSGPGVQTDPELPTVQGQLIVFARELGELYRLERSRNAELETVLESLRDTYLATMKSLATVIEAKDQTTRGHLERTLKVYIAHYNAHRPHRALQLEPPDPAAAVTLISGHPPARVHRRDLLGGLLHEYRRAA